MALSCTSAAKYMALILQTKVKCLTHWGRVMHICISKLTIIVSDNGLSPAWCHVIISANAGILLIGPLWINFNVILIKIHTFSFTKIYLKMAAILSRPQCVNPSQTKQSTTGFCAYFIRYTVYVLFNSDLSCMWCGWLAVDGDFACFSVAWESWRFTTRARIQCIEFPLWR